MTIQPASVARPFCSKLADITECSRPKLNTLHFDAKLRLPPHFCAFFIFIIDFAMHNPTMRPELQVTKMLPPE
jgi:hypothetical protein